MLRGLAGAVMAQFRQALVQFSHQQGLVMAQ